MTLGDPAGIGLQLAAKLLSNSDNLARADLFVLADRSEVEAAAAVSNVKIPISNGTGTGRVTVLEDCTAPVIAIHSGKVSREAGERAFHQLK